MVQAAGKRKIQMAAHGRCNFELIGWAIFMVTTRIRYFQIKAASRKIFLCCWLMMSRIVRWIGKIHLWKTYLPLNKKSCYCGKNLLQRTVRFKKKSNHIKILEEYILSLKQKQFGSSSEKLSSAQAELFDEADGDAAEMDAVMLLLLTPLRFPRIPVAPKDAYRFLLIFLVLILFTTCVTTKKSARMMERH